MRRWVVLVNGSPVEIFESEQSAYQRAAVLTWEGLPDDVTVEEIEAE